MKINLEKLIRAFKIEAEASSSETSIGFQFSKVSLKLEAQIFPECWLAASVLLPSRSSWVKQLRFGNFTWNIDEYAD